jgi:ribulose-5-phosphate 4-epimerase/fuculose-1-phosphate aldolase
MDMTGKEGVIKFSLDYTPTGPLPEDELRELNAWRKVCHLCGLIGRDPSRYGGYGYGNISRRLRSGGAGRAFIISGSQTGHLADLSPSDYALVLECVPAENRVVASGPVKPSSESLTHGALYALATEVGGVIHAHSPDIWRRAHALRIPTTSAAMAYGTPELAVEIGRLFAESDARQRGILAMGGHEDGIVAFGATVAQAGLTLVRTLALAFEQD